MCRAFRPEIGAAGAAGKFFRQVSAYAGAAGHPGGTVRKMARYKHPAEVNPCLSCTLVRDPENCQNKNCVAWQQWFIRRWDQLRLACRREMEELELTPIGVNIGGSYYTPAHRRLEYLRNNPCDNCLCPKDLCQTPCLLRRTWDDAREEWHY